MSIACLGLTKNVYPAYKNLTREVFARLLHGLAFCSDYGALAFVLDIGLPFFDLNLRSHREEVDRPALLRPYLKTVIGEAMEFHKRFCSLITKVEKMFQSHKCACTYRQLEPYYFELTVHLEIYANKLDKESAYKSLSNLKDLIKKETRATNKELDPLIRLKVALKFLVTREYDKDTILFEWPEPAE